MGPTLLDIYSSPSRGTLVYRWFTFIPCHLEMALRGRRARSVLSDLSAVRLALPSTAKLNIETYWKRKKYLSTVEMIRIHMPFLISTVQNWSELIRNDQNWYPSLLTISRASLDYLLVNLRSCDDLMILWWSSDDLLIILWSTYDHRTVILRSCLICINMKRVV